MEVLLTAGGGPPALHRHAPEEVYRLDHGHLAVYLEDGQGNVQRILAEPGDVVHIPGGRAHTVRNESDADALAYVVFAPGREIERFIRAAGELAADGAADGGDVPRGVDFLFDEHRFNVAISRAQCLAVLVYSPRLLDADCTTLATMARLDGICRFVEMAEAIPPPHE